MNSNANITVIVFSKNRTMQLYSLLKSLLRYSNIPMNNIHILAKYDNEYFASLKEVFKVFDGQVHFINETNFQNQTLELIQQSKNYVVFFTDDDLLKKEFKIEDCIQILETNKDILTFSLRLGLHLNFCYPVQQSQTLPNYKELSDDKIVFDYEGKSWDWNYPLSVNGHIFRKEQILHFSKMNANWQAPNSYEGALQACLSFASKQMNCNKMASYKDSVVFNLPINKVQTENSNISGNVDSLQLLNLWNEGKEINIDQFHNIQNISAHQEFPLSFTERTYVKQ